MSPLHAITALWRRPTKFVMPIAERGRQMAVDGVDSRPQSPAVAPPFRPRIKFGRRSCAVISASASAAAAPTILSVFLSLCSSAVSVVRFDSCFVTATPEVYSFVKPPSPSILPKAAASSCHPLPKPCPFPSVQPLLVPSSALPLQHEQQQPVPLLLQDRCRQPLSKDAEWPTLRRSRLSTPSSSLTAMR